MVSTTLLSSLLALAPPDAPDARAPFDVSDVEVAASDGAVQLTAFDAEGEVSAEVVLWTDGDGHTRLDTNFADGVYQAVTIDGEHVTVDTNDAAAVAERLAVLETNQASWEDVSVDDVVFCAGSLIGAAGAAATGNLFGCIGASLIAGVSCGNVLEGLAE